MESNTLYEKLMKLERLEELGKHYFETYGAKLTYSQYLYLKKHFHIQLGITDLFTLSAIAEQKQIESDIHSMAGDNGLNAQFFLTDGNNIEIEKTLRYVDIPKHCHQFIECIYIMQGDCEHTINNNTFHQTTGCFTILTSNDEHYLNVNSNCLCLGIKIRSDTFVNLKVPNLPLFAIPLCFQCENDEFVQHLILDIYSQQAEQLLYHESIIHMLFQTLLTRCMQSHQDTMQFLFTGSRIRGKMLEITNYMFENYQTITLRALAEHFHYSEAYLSNLIHEQSGYTFSTILSSFKIEQATSLLQTTNLKLNDICESIGYKDTTQFIRDFKKRYEITPAKYRKQFILNQIK